MRASCDAATDTLTIRDDPKMPETAIDALVFDLDDTLVVEKDSATAAFLHACQLAAERCALDPATLDATVRETCRELWHHHSPARTYAVEVGISSWEALWSRFEGEHEDLALLRNWAPSYRRDSWLNALRLHGVDDVDLAAELANAFISHRRARHVVYDDVRPALERLRGRYRMALLTNGASDLQREKIAGAGLAPCFDEVLVAADIGISKPDPRIFRALLTRLRIEPQAAVMLGDSQSRDIQGAAAVGMRTIWVNRTGLPRRNGVTCDLEVANLTECVEWITARTPMR